MQGCPSVFEVICGLMPGYHQVVWRGLFEFCKPQELTYNKKNYVLFPYMVNGM